MEEAVASGDRGPGFGVGAKQAAFFALGTQEEQDTNSPSSPWHSKGLLLLYKPFAVGSKQIIEIHMFSHV